MAEGVQPKGSANGLRSSLVRVEKLLSSALRQVSDGLLSNPILEMGIHAAKGEFLLLLLAVEAKKIVRETPIIAMIVGDADAVLGGEAFRRHVSPGGSRWT